MRRKMDSNDIAFLAITENGKFIARVALHFIRYRYALLHVDWIAGNAFGDQKSHG